MLHATCKVWIKCASMGSQRTRTQEREVYRKRIVSVASLGLVSPGAATEGVTPIFSAKKTDDLVFSYYRSACQFSGVAPIFFSWNNWRPFFPHHCHFYWFHSGVTSWRVLFYLSDLVCPLFFVNCPQRFCFVRVSLFWRVVPCPLPPPLVTPLHRITFYATDCSMCVTSLFQLHIIRETWLSVKNYIQKKFEERWSRSRQLLPFMWCVCSKNSFVALRSDVRPSSFTIYIAPDVVSYCNSPIFIRASLTYNDPSILASLQPPTLSERFQLSWPLYRHARVQAAE